MNRKTFLPLAIVLLSLAMTTARSQQTAPAKSTENTATVSIPFELVTRHIIVKVCSNSRRCPSFLYRRQGGIIDMDRAKEPAESQGPLRVCVAVHDAYPRDGL